MMLQMFSLTLPPSQPNLTPTFHLLKEFCVVTDNKTSADRPPFDFFTIAIADQGDLGRLTTSDERLTILLREYADQKAGCRLILDCATEGWPFDQHLFSCLHAHFLLLGILASDVTMISTNHLLPIDYSAWVKDQDILPMRFFIYDYWCYRLASEALNARTDVTTSPRHFEVSKKLLSFNRIPKAHRMAVLLKLLSISQIDNCIVSFMPDTQTLNDHEKSELRVYLEALGWPVINDLLSHVESFLRRIPIANDQSVGTPYLDYVFGGVDLIDYHKVGFAVITESDFGIPNVDRVTEKPFKAIANRCPFLIVGQPGQIRRLETLGFSNYGMFSYEFDLVDDPNERLRLLLDQIQMLALQSNDLLQKQRQNMAAIAEFNLNNLLLYGSHHRLLKLAKLIQENC